MKIRTDYVTNSSSSSFILARKGELTEAQKAAIIEFVEVEMLGRKMLTPENSEEEIQKLIDEAYINEYYQEEIRDALKQGNSIYGGWVSFEQCEYDYADMLTSLWEKLEEVDGENFKAIDGSLEY